MVAMNWVRDAQPVPGSATARASSRLVPLSVRANVAWNVVGSVVYAACQWGMLVVLAKLGSPETVGLFALGLAVTAPVIMFTNLHLMALQRTDTAQQFAFGDYFGLRLVTTAIALVIIIGVVLIAGYRGERAEVILVIGLAKAVESISNVVHGFLQQHQRMDRIATSLTIKGLLSVVALGGGVLATGQIVGGAIALLGAWAVTLIGYDLRSGRQVAVALASDPATRVVAAQRSLMRPRWEPGQLRPLAGLAFPLGVATLLTSLTINVPRYVIEGQLGARELGIFAAMAYLVVAADTLAMALGQAASPRLAALYASGDRKRFQTLLIGMIAAGTLGAALGVLAAALAGRKLLTLLYGPAYALYVDVFVWLMVAVGIGFVASVLTYGITAARQYRVQAPLAGGVLLAMVVACMVLIPPYGLAGAAAGMIAAATVNLAGTAVVMARALSHLPHGARGGVPGVAARDGAPVSGGTHVRQPAR
jgi:O-antigen/teichoic acid export membrane protein